MQQILLLEKRVQELETRAKDDIQKLHKRINELRLRSIQETIMMVDSRSFDREKVELGVVQLELQEE